MSDSDTKQKLGQFYTTNYDYILQNLIIPPSVNIIIEPFAGNGDLLKFVNNTNTNIKVESYDIDPKKSFIIQRDTLMDPPNYKDKFVITNPPYLARNKSNEKHIFDKYGQNDLYKCFIQNLIQDVCYGGILIIPLNFWCSIRSTDIQLRKNFLHVYDISVLNIFEEKVFEDTGYSICSFSFIRKNNENESSIINTYIYPKKSLIKISLNEDNNYTVGGEIYKLPQNKNIKIDRLTSHNIDSKYKTNILVKCIDDNENNKISMSIVPDNKIYIDKTPNNSARSYATLVIQPEITIKQQNELVILFNEYINIMRDNYNSLFLTNYRESNSIARKRLSFNLAFLIVNYLLDKHFILE